eukprot:TRINITY_DN2957_c0_g6_i1.p1 TRINITY_DN2957_c0_g6~~TRINITY_DN2957_c0_g6_i1.p1  ORF type:complete len:229 (+),score=37.94 TRINITY_DN2957_c0_g6_i1:64-750(+)
MIVSNHFSFGGGRLEHGHFTYESASSGSPGTLLEQRQRSRTCLAVSALACGVPACFEVCVFAWKRQASCDQPLAAWMLLDGVSAVVLATLQLYALHSIFLSVGDEEVERHQRVESAHGVVQATYGQRRKDLTPCDVSVLKGQQLMLICVAVSFLIGWTCSNNTSMCDETLAQLVRAVLAYKTVSLVLACCCAPCLVGVGLALLTGPQSLGATAVGDAVHDDQIALVSG